MGPPCGIPLPLLRDSLAPLHRSFLAPKKGFFSMPTFFSGCSSLPVLVLDGHALTDPGQHRVRNDDTVWIARGEHPSNPAWSWALYLVADGMDGLEQGKQASLLAAQCITTTIGQHWPYLSHSGHDRVEALLRQSVEEANRAIHARNLAEHTTRGTTLTAVLLVNQQAYIANVGDSRAYLYRAQASRLIQLTQDHSIVARLLETGAISAADVVTHPQRNLIYRFLGAQHEVKVDLFQTALLSGDGLLLCSDGLWERVSPQELQAVFRERLPACAMARVFVDMANAKGGEDNISAVVVTACSVPPASGDLAPLPA
jgi:serine/threonine protein phosphatase PrpC